MTEREALNLALDALETSMYPQQKQLQAITAIKEALAQPEQYTTDAMKVRQAVAQALHDDVYAEELEQPEAKQSGTISITMPAPVAYLCENAVGHKYFRWKKPSSTYKPIPLYTTPPQRKPLTDEAIATVYWGATGQSLRPQDNVLAHNFARAIEAAHGIAGEKNGTR